MIILADENMPLVAEHVGPWGELRLLPGRSIGPKDVAGADALFVRSVTRVDAKLLAGSTVRFVGTATIGTDHLDTAWLDAQAVAWSAAPGCNAVSVAEYVVAVIAALRLEGQLGGTIESRGGLQIPPAPAGGTQGGESPGTPLRAPRASPLCGAQGGSNTKRLRAGVVGVGNVGSRVASRLEKLGFTVLRNDPPRAEREPGFHSVPLADLAGLDLVCLHAPLEKTGVHPTFHLVGEEFLSRMKDGAVLLSAGRGEVVDFAALRRHAHRLVLALDVWEPEPEVDLDLLAAARFATPHVAGYSTQGKWRGTSMVAAAAAKVFNKVVPAVPQPLAPPVMDFRGRSIRWEDVVLAVYDPREDTARTKAALAPLASGPERAKAFDKLRKDYPVRHELDFPIYASAILSATDRALLEGLGCRFAGG